MMLVVIEALVVLEPGLPGAGAPGATEDAARRRAPAGCPG